MSARCRPPTAPAARGEDSGGPAWAVLAWSGASHGEIEEMGPAGDAQVVVANRLLALPGQVLIVEIQPACCWPSACVPAPTSSSAPSPAGSPSDNFCSYPHHRQIRQLGKTRKCSNIDNVAPDPGSCTALCLRLHGRARIFLLYTAVSARTPKTEGTATPRGNYFPVATCPVPLTAARISSSGRWASGQEHPHQGEPL